MWNRKLLRIEQPLLCFALLVSVPSIAQLKWDGEAGDGQWMTARNWVGDKLPAITDDIILDNAFITGGYTVTLPGGNSSVHIRSIAIAPGPGNTIELILPATNTAIPAFIISGAVYGMVIGNGGIFKNASGTDSGLPVEIADSLKINNGGRYIQNTSGSHAAIVTVLSKAPGTEEGIFEFDLPTASSTVSLSDRSYGKLIFSSNAMNGAVTYTASGTNPVTIRSDLYVGTGVSLSLNFTDTLFIGRDLIQQGGTINLGTAARTLVTVINRHLVQSVTGLICETGKSFPEIVFGGVNNQHIDCKGTLKDSVTIKMNNTAGATLTSPWALPYKLKLAKGNITTSVANILQLLAGCSIEVDSLLSNSFIDGPLRKEGLSAAAHFLFPVGKGGTMRWLALKNVSGNFKVEFFSSNPQQLSNTYGSGIKQISQTGYWTIQADASPLPSAAVELSFNGPNSVVGTNLATARVAKLDNNVWVNGGNTAYTGTAGSRGSIVSNTMASWSGLPKYFTLGSSELADAPLTLSDALPGIRNNAINNNGGSLRLLSVSFPNAQVLTCRASEKTKASLCMVTSNGVVVKVTNMIVERGVNNLPVQMASLPAGVYSLYAVTAKGASNVLRFVYIK
ncbi:hypothetical protein A3860_28375 [Niastella vici]|uniref:Secretion system C-terminal sorting domain-containing protein n=1 Tax=Niastella vici TaxID=1703345 RepID=A0A1V9FVK8_9BACT|nr:hypothetical protein [Niastella vici]OQP62286.1 hypothetical protein A3860_28375 [Niastella vici]